MAHAKPKFNYSFDVRGKPLQQARHWSAPEIFGSRAKFNADTDPATLDIDVNAMFGTKTQSIQLSFIFSGYSKA